MLLKLKHREKAQGRGTEHPVAARPLRQSNILITEIPEWGGRSIEEIMAENFPRSMTDTNPQIQEAQRTPSRAENKRNTSNTYLGISH